MTLRPGRFPPGFEWDEAKNQANIRKHGIDFQDAVQIFETATLARVDGRRDYGEVRVNSIGSIRGLIIATVTHTDRSGTVRLISARAASSVERAAYLAFTSGHRRPGPDPSNGEET